MSAVTKLIDVLKAAGLSAEWHNTGGGCMAIRIPFGVSESHPYGVSEILITDREDVFVGADYYSDDDVYGFFARAYRLDTDGATLDDDDSEGWLYCTMDEAGVCKSSQLDGEPVVNLNAEVRQVASAVLGAVGDGFVGKILLPCE